MNILPLAMLALLALAFWFLVLRPAKARQAAAAKVVSEIEVGQRVMTTAGMFGYVRAITDEEISLEIAPDVVVQMLKPAIAKVAEDDFSEIADDSAPEPAAIAQPAPDSVTVADASPDSVTLDKPAADAIDISKSN